MPKILTNYDKFSAVVTSGNFIAISFLNNQTLLPFRENDYLPCFSTHFAGK